MLYTSECQFRTFSKCTTDSSERSRLDLVNVNRGKVSLMFVNVADVFKVYYTVGIHISVKAYKNILARGSEIYCNIDHESPAQIKFFSVACD